MTIEGSNFFGYASTTFDNSAAPSVDERWTIFIGETLSFEATLQGSESLEVTLPGGMPEGQFDVSAVSSDGRRTELADALTVTSTPITTAFRIVDIIHPAQVIPGTKGIPVSIQVENGLSEDVPLTGFTLSFGNDNVLVEDYYIFPYAGAPHRVRAGETESILFMVGIDGSAEAQEVAVQAHVDGFLLSSRTPIERTSDSSWTIVPGTPLAPQHSAPELAETALCEGDALRVDGQTSSGEGELAFFWDLPGSALGSATGAQPEPITYDASGASLYSLRVSNAVSEAIRFAPFPVFVGSLATPIEQHATGPIAFSSPLGNQAVDLTSLPNDGVFRQDEADGVRQCDGSRVSAEGKCYLEVFSDRGRISQAHDSRPDLAGIQVALADCSHMESLTLEPDDAGLEGSATLCAESRDEVTGVVTASGTVAFRMTGDRTAPAVSPLAPAAGCTEACLGGGSPVLFQFGEPMDSASVEANTRVEQSNASNCAGGFSDVTADATITYDEHSRTVRIVPPPNASALHSLRVSFPSTVTDAATAANSLAEQSYCFVVDTMPSPAVPSAPEVTQISPHAISPDGDGEDEKVSIGVVTTDETSLIEVSVQRSTIVVRKLLIPVAEAGTHRAVWDGRDNDGRVVPNGYYALHIRLHNAAGGVSEKTTEIVEVASSVSCIGVSNRF